MIKLIILRFWPALIPLAIYVGWLVYLKKRAKSKEVPPEMYRTPLYWSLILSAFLIVASFVFFGMSMEPNRGEHYVPPRYENNTLVPGHTESQ